MKAAIVSSQIGGEEKVEQLQNNARPAKKIAMKSLRKSLSEVLQVSLEEHILDNILGHLNLLDEEANDYWRLEIADEDIPGLSSLYLHLSQIYNEMKNGLFWYCGNAYLTPAPIDQLEKTVSELKTEVSIEED